MKHQKTLIRQFLLTRLLRGVTNIGFSTEFVSFNFYSHASCEA